MRGRAGRTGAGAQAGGHEGGDRGGDGTRPLPAGRLGIYDFGTILLESQDLDPVYVIVHGTPLEPATLRKWLLAYWCYYHVGTACWAAQQSQEGSYWAAMRQAAGSKEWPRGSERRHYRGGQALASVDWLSSQGLARLFEPLAALRTLDEVMRVVGAWRGFGQWISFKVADMLERLGLAAIAFTDSDVLHLFDSPRQAIALMAEYHGPVVGEGMDTWALARLYGRLGAYPAPPGHDRPINIQELETILCKWKSHLGGHYPPGKDSEEIRHSLLRFGRCRLSQAMLAAGRRAGLWHAEVTGP